MTHCHLLSAIKTKQHLLFRALCPNYLLERQEKQHSSGVGKERLFLLWLSAVIATFISDYSNIQNYYSSGLPHE